MINKVLNLRVNELKIDSSRKISRLYLLLVKRRSRKLYILDSNITSLKVDNDFSNNNYIIIAPTRKVALAALDSIMHSYKNSLSLPV